MTVVYPRISGSDHNSLLVCLTLVEKCVGRGAKDTVSDKVILIVVQVLLI